MAPELPEPPTIRPATAADIAAITAIYADAVRHGTATFELEPPDRAEMLRRFAALSEANFPYLVAEERTGVAGYAYAGPYRARPAYRFTVEDSVYLAPSAQGRGIGSALLARLIAATTQRGFRQMIAVIGDSANVASVRTHACAGFALIGTHPDVGFKFGRWLDTVMMQRALGEGAATTPSGAA
jgi:phosphinothricin acetyltransferase